MRPNIQTHTIGMRMMQIVSSTLVQKVGFSNGCVLFGPEQAAAIGAELLDRHEGRHRARARSSAPRLRALSPPPRLRRSSACRRAPAASRQQAQTARSTRNAARCRSTKKFPSGLPASPRASAVKRGDAGRRRHELLPHQRAELRCIAQRNLARIVLQVRVGGEGGGGVEDQVAVSSPFAVRIERQVLLQRQDGGTSP